ncbi:MAG: hypothetical protein AAF992_02750 [Bacteroidota bacterium]
MKSSRKVLFGKSLLIAFVGTILVTVVLVYLTGLTSHRSVLNNSLISLTVLALAFFFFLLIGLFNGLDVLDNYSHKLQLSRRNARRRMPDSSWASSFPDVSAPDVGDGLGGIIIGIILWVILSILLIVALVLLQAVVWVTIVLIVIAIYWVFIRGLKLIFSKSPQCEGNFPKSPAYASGYTVLYVGWIYAVIYASTLF